MAQTRDSAVVLVVDDSAVVLVVDDGVLTEAGPRLQDFIVRKPGFLALPVGGDLIDIALRLAEAVFEDAHDFVVETACRAEGSHAGELTSRDRPEHR
jgi:hypothetical protein